MQRGGRVSEEHMKGTMSNNCTCAEHSLDENNEPLPDDYYCDGWCWDDALEDFSQCLSEMGLGEVDAWEVRGIKLWNRTTGGFFRAKDTAELIRHMTVNSCWTMTWTMYADRIEYSLSHHDAPMGSSSVLCPAKVCEVCTEYIEEYYHDDCEVVA